MNNSLISIDKCSEDKKINLLLDFKKDLWIFYNSGEIYTKQYNEIEKQLESKLDDLENLTEIQVEKWVNKIRKNYRIYQTLVIEHTEEETQKMLELNISIVEKAYDLLQDWTINKHEYQFTLQSLDTLSSNMKSKTLEQYIATINDIEQVLYMESDSDWTKKEKTSKNRK